MTTDRALHLLLARYRDAVTDAEEADDAEAASVAEQRRDRLSGLISARAKQRVREREAAMRRGAPPQQSLDHY